MEDPQVRGRDGRLVPRRRHRRAHLGADAVAARLDLLCPQGHKIIRAAVDTDGNWHPYLRPVDEDDDAEGRFGSARWSLHKDPEMHPYDIDVRVRLRCPTCTYDGVLGADRLLALAGVAVACGRRSLRLTD